ncbi:alpha/beta hydrolase [Segniliparus rugosus]|uniref:DUF1023 domain-containing protein n=1 Tax=Segniliparus rugosus (strain ATCC BAA-974 / DSM 45345 / CCUG 50838 / CIP 108380 / JCM 13579 / CDC 945) TaxID=679197 RepID=E5XNN1_SEGRC|nr:alpha/beta hydrolase [Segniliparus rugosus]EFV14021.1 hypothetical protein HMPREF9336_01102 [Segniliparus rugosus ATCC BAA-974]
MSGKITRKIAEAVDPSHLGDLARALRAQAGKYEPEQSQFSHRLRFPGGGEEFTGQASDTLQLTGQGMGKTYGLLATKMRDVAGQCEQAEGHIGHAASVLRSKIVEIEAEPVGLDVDGKHWNCGDPFTVSDDLSVQVKPGSVPAGAPPQVGSALAALASQRGQDLAPLAQQLSDVSDTWGAKIKAAFDVTGLGRNAKGQAYAPYDPNNTVHQRAAAIANGTMGVPSDPKQLHDLWQQLTREEKEAIYDRYHDIGNHGGIPFDPPDHLGRDHYNQQHLKDMMKTATGDDLKKLQTLANVARPGQNPPRYLGFLDDKGHAAVSINNPDTAKKNATLVPGTYSDESKMGDYDRRSFNLYRSAIDHAEGKLGAGDVSVTTWMGYDAPQSVPNPFNDKWAGDPKFALEGANALDQWQDGIRASHSDNSTGGPSFNTVIGHSYGTTEVGAAATHGNHLDADAVIAVASPGMFADNAHGLSLAGDAQVYVAKNSNDPINIANAGSFIGASDLGNDPADWKDAHQVGSTPGGTFYTSDAHQAYFEPGNEALNNMGRIIDGTDSATNVTPKQ